MKVHLLIPGMNRTKYLMQIRRALRIYTPELYEHRDEFHDINGLGMAEAIRQAWEAALDRDWDYLLHWEEDMLPLTAPPIEEAVKILDADRTLANIVFKREPWSAEEHEAGDVITSSVAHAKTWEDCGTHTTHDHIFSLNPCLIPRPVVELGWPSGNEAQMTSELREAGWRFAFYGVAGDVPLVRHIGQERGTGWAL